MRKLIAGMQMSVDGKIEGTEGFADWVETWSDNYNVMPQIDACLLGAKMYPGYEWYWSAVQNAPDQPLPMTNRLPTPAELDWARFAAKTPHYVLSSTLDKAAWPLTRFVRALDDIAALKQQPGKDIYLMGGAHITASLIEAGLVDELRLGLHPLIAGEGKALFGTGKLRRQLDLRNVEQLKDGRVNLIYAVR
ncbi:dihydrofolate reductase family protein [Mesorhizobium sp. INR15]|uniref:dihydrofolate reductase family protein n=1 Tax=Mesorhizobium sp. INR15 TaxID=2654248 RepID=UPI001896A48A|nr:dihydrofolate reductase family protein [Mesorhizobium sp. INR15]QPC91798.1 dihydrofolate reductase [Mesorhizobium sp. INR15]